MNEFYQLFPTYIGGKTHPTLYNCGAGLEKETKTGSQEDSFMQCIDTTDINEFLAYCEALETAGFSCDFSNETNDLLCREYRKDDKLLYIYHTVLSHRTKIIWDRVNKPLPGFSKFINEAKNHVPVAIMQFGLYQSAMIPGTSCDCGMMYVVRLKDNSLLVIDGGEYEQATDLAVDEFLVRVRELTGEEKFTISAWFCTHNHNDHMDFFSKLLRFHADKFNLERVIFNFSSKTVLHYENICTDILKDRILQHFPNVAFLKPHTGQLIELAGVQFEVITTHEDLLPDRFDENRQYRGMNETTTVVMLHYDGDSLLLLGDCEERNEDVILLNHFHRGLNCTFLQAAHHGINRNEKLYNFIKAKTILLPQCRFVNERSQKENFSVLCRNYGRENIFFAADCTRIYVKTAQGYDITRYPVVGYIYDGSEH